MAQVLVHISTGPENATKAALGFLVAKTVLEQGHKLSIFLSGDAVNLLRKDTVETLNGLGTGQLSAHVATIRLSVDTPVYYSVLSAKARGLTPDVLAIDRAEPAQADKLVELAVAAGTVLSY
jgi:predicted peroxiredoxin